MHEVSKSAAVRTVSAGGRLSLRVTLVRLDNQDALSVDLYDVTGFVEGIMLDLDEAAQAGRALLDLAGEGIE